MSQPQAPPLAVAVRYDAPDAPRVVAIGRGELGQRIIDTAREHGVPIEQNPALAAALATVELDSEIPEALYAAMAIIIAFILRTATAPAPAGALKP